MTNGARLPTARDHRGFALLAVLWVSAMLATIAMGYAVSARLKGLEAHHAEEFNTGALDLASGLELAEFEYQKYRLNRHLLLQPVTADDAEDPVELCYPRFEPYTRSIADRSYDIRIVSELGKFNVNMIDSARWQEILRACGVDEEEAVDIADSIADWIDKDDLNRIGGAESDYYQSLSPGYLCKNQNIENIEELLLIKGISPELFSGSGDTPGLQDFVSVYGSTEQLDINSASPLAFTLVPELPAEVAEQIVAMRQEKPIIRMADLQDVVPFEKFSEFKMLFDILPPRQLSIEVTVGNKSQRRILPAG